MSNNGEQSTIKILFLSADPTEASRLRLGQEIRDIREKLQLSRDRNRFHLESRECVRPHDISQFIFDVEPHIIHFAGHSTNAGELCFEDMSGNLNPIKPDALAELFELLNKDINCVVLNACYSAKQAKAIARYIPYVIGMDQAIQDQAAIIFAVGFYKAIGAGKTVDDAFNFGKIELKLLGVSEEMIPILHKKRKVRELRNINNQPKEDAEQKIVITITGTFQDLNAKFISKLYADLKEMSNDASLKIDKIESGSIKITLSGNPEGVKRLATSLKSEEATEKLGISVKEVKLLSGDSKEVNLSSGSSSSKYWNIWQISLASTGAGYKYSLVPPAREFFQKQIANSQLEDTQTALLSYFHATTADTEAALAGLCLRCYISESILKACKKIDYLFGSEKHFNYQELLPFVLNDDGETLIVLGSDSDSVSDSEALASPLPRGDAKGERASERASALLQSADHKTQFVLNNNSKTQTPTYKFFSMRILQTFKIDSQRQMSLENWVYLQTKQNPEIQDFLKEFGFKHLSDWALLNRAKPKHLERLSARERRILEIFHAVYRRDRLQQHQRGARRCPDPSKLQLQEMLYKLQDLDIIIHSTIELMKEIKQVAMQLRHYDIWSSREPLEIKDQDTGNYTPRPDLPTDFLQEADIEEQEFIDLFHEQLKPALDIAIESEIRALITKLEKSKNYAPFAPQLIPGLQLYYCDQLSLKEITPKLGMTSRDQARRILNPGELLSKVRTSTVQQLLNSILKKASEKGLTKIPPEPEYLKILLVEIEAFCDREIFTEAAEEIRAGNNRSLDSFYADKLRLYFQQHQ